MDEERGRGESSGGSMEGERRGLGGAARTPDPAGGAAGGEQDRHFFFILKWALI